MVLFLIFVILSLLVGLLASWRRPDRQAEEQLIAANAEIGVARAAYFPQISLSGTSGFQSSALSNLFTGPAVVWSFGASLTQPIFTGGRLRSGVRGAESYPIQDVCRAIEVTVWSRGNESNKETNL